MLLLLISLCCVTYSHNNNLNVLVDRHVMLFPSAFAIPIFQTHKMLQTGQIYLKLRFFWVTYVRQSNHSPHVLEEAQWRHCHIRGNATKLNLFSLQFPTEDTVWSILFSLFAGLCVTVRAMHAPHLLLHFSIFKINRSLSLPPAHPWRQPSLGQRPNAHLQGSRR